MSTIRICDYCGAHLNQDRPADTPSIAGDYCDGRCALAHQLAVECGRPEYIIEQRTNNKEDGTTRP